MFFLVLHLISIMFCIFFQSDSQQFTYFTQWNFTPLNFATKSESLFILSSTKYISIITIISENKNILNLHVQSDKSSFKDNKIYFKIIQILEESCVSVEKLIFLKNLVLILTIIYIVYNHFVLRGRVYFTDKDLRKLKMLYTQVHNATFRRNIWEFIIHIYAFLIDN